MWCLLFGMCYMSTILLDTLDQDDHETCSALIRFSRMWREKTKKKIKPFQILKALHVVVYMVLVVC